MSTEDPNADEPGDEFLQLTGDFIAFLKFTSYELDASPLTSPTFLPTTQNLPLNNTSIQVDPTWMLVA